MAKLAAVKVACMVVVCMVVAARSAEASISCSTVVSKLGPCLSYVQGKTALPPTCCNSIKSLAAIANSTPDRQTACRCLKTIAANTKGINMGLAAGLPRKCGVSIGYPISTSVDCSKIH